MKKHAIIILVVVNALLAGWNFVVAPEPLAAGGDIFFDCCACNNADEPFCCDQCCWFDETCDQDENCSCEPELPEG